MERIGFGLRFGAALIDVVIIVVVVMVVSMLFGGGMAALSGGEGFEGPGYLVLLIISLLPLAYSLLEIIKAATPGKMALGLSIRSADGTPATREVLMKRWGIKNVASIFRSLAALTTLNFIGMIGGLLGLVVFVGCFFCLGETRQALHDKLAGTAIYKG